MATISFWRYAVFSTGALSIMLAIVGGIHLFMELLDFIGLYTKDHYPRYAIFPILGFAVVTAVFTRRPVGRISFRAPGKDYRIDVKIADLLAEPADLVISCNTTFDTDLASGLINAESVQGQLALKLFEGNTAALDRQLAEGLKDVRHKARKNAPGKDREYPMGTVAPVRIPGRTFYFVAMSRLNEQGNAEATVHDVEQALESLWAFIAKSGELREIAIPLMGTGRGRIPLPRKKMVERIAQSFADASRDKIFSNRLTVVIRPADAENFDVNLWEVRDYLARSLHT